MGIIIGADFVPTDTNEDLFEAGNITRLFGNELAQILKESDYRIFNLEIPLTEVADPIKKCGPNLMASPKGIRAYVESNVDLVTLANNHILDQGFNGLNSTINVLDDNNINHVGAGRCIEDAARPFFFQYSKYTIGVYACTEHEFSVSDLNKPGANPFDPLYSLDHIRSAKEKSDYLIVLYHGGKEHYRYPSPYLQKVCHRIIECGADLVLCQHSHCIGCEEAYESGLILYGQGNFIFDHNDDECWKTGLLLNIDDHLQVQYIPIIKTGNVVKLADQEERKQILDDFYKRSDQIKKEGFIQKNYREFAISMTSDAYQTLSGRNSFLFRVVNKMLGNALWNLLIRKRYSSKELLKLIDRIECEAWRELTLEVLRIEVFGDN